MNSSSLRFATLVALLAFCLPAIQNASAAGPATNVRVLSVDLASRIDESARFPERFAVGVEHRASTSSDGTWLRGATSSEWSYSVRIPGAVSMSFHASRLRLTSGATLVVEGGGKRVVYHARDVVNGGLWSHVFRGDTLELHLLVSNSEANGVALELGSLQAGYRGLGGGVPDHPQFRRALAAAAATATCNENFACHETPANQGPGDATAAILIGNVAQCTGTLINNVRADAAPFFLTARHCQSDVPNAAMTVAIYWDAVTPCGSALGEIYDSTSPIQQGGNTMIEQQDTWLIRLNEQATSATPYFAGWDATGGTFVGGYAIHHAMGRTKQYAGWFGQAVLVPLPGSAIGTGYDASFWGVVNSVGSIGAGASGGALFDPSNRVVGVASLADLQAGEGSDGVCPRVPPPVPTVGNATALYDALSSVWDSTADPTSTTNPHTLREFLDPDDSGQRVVDGLAYQPGATFTADATDQYSGRNITLTWNVPGAGTCVASGGLPGDRWAGNLAGSGTLVLTEDDGGVVRYTIRCPVGDRIAVASVLVTWTQLPPMADVAVVNIPPVIVGDIYEIRWISNLKTCIAEGGTPGDGWAGTREPNGELHLTAMAVGKFDFRLTCSSGSRTASSVYTLDVQPPYATLTSDANNLRIGQFVLFSWNGARNCTASGGAPGDSWAGPLDVTPKAVFVNVAGAYDYTITCTAGGLTATTTVRLTFTDDPPTAVLIANPTTIETPPFPVPNDYSIPPNLQWVSNVRECRLSFTAPGISQGFVFLQDNSAGSGIATDIRAVAGHYTYVLTCGSGPTATEATATIDWFTTHPVVQVFGPPNGIVANQPFFMNWGANVFPCTSSGGVPGDGWAGPQPLASGNFMATLATPGTYIYHVTCGSGSNMAEGEFTAVVPDPAVTITADRNSVFVGGMVTLQWQATTSPCVASSDPASGTTWDGPQDSRGGRAVSESVPGTYTYTLTCGIAPNTASNSVQVMVSPIPQPAATLTASTTNAGVNEPVTLTWSAVNTDFCSPYSTPNTSDWSVLANFGPNGSANVASFSPGTITYGVNCNGAAAEVTVTYSAAPTGGDPTPRPSVVLSTNVGILSVGQMLTLNWDSQNSAQCIATGGGNGDGWNGSLPLTGNMSLTEAIAGPYTYQITCSGAPPAAIATASVTFTDQPAPPPSGGGGGGGGSIDFLELMVLALAMLRAAWKSVPRAWRYDSLRWSRRPVSFAGN